MRALDAGRRPEGQATADQGARARQGLPAPRARPAARRFATRPTCASTTTRASIAAPTWKRCCARSRRATVTSPRTELHGVLVRRQERGSHLARRGRGRAARARNARGRPHWHARPDGHRRAGAGGGRGDQAGQPARRAVQGLPGAHAAGHRDAYSGCGGRGHRYAARAGAFARCTCGVWPSAFMASCSSCRRWSAQSRSTARACTSGLRAGEVVERRRAAYGLIGWTSTSSPTTASRCVCECGKGFYVRSLARDLAEALGTRRPPVGAAPHPQRPASTVDGAINFDELRTAAHGSDEQRARARAPRTAGTGLPGLATRAAERAGGAGGAPWTRGAARAAAHAAARARAGGAAHRARRSGSAGRHRAALRDVLRVARGFRL